jgi:hypothetical protein
MVLPVEQASAACHFTAICFQKKTSFMNPGSARPGNKLPCEGVLQAGIRYNAAFQTVFRMEKRDKPA